MSSDELSKGAERTAREKYQARKAYLVNRTKETETKLDLDKNAPDETLHESDKVESLSRGVKRPRVQEEPAQEHESAESPSDVSGLTQPRTRTPSHTTTSKKVSTSEGRSGHQLNKGHNGDLLAGGCSCPPCVRRWAKKLMIRMQQLEDEVLMLSREKSTGAATTKTASAKPRVDSEATQCLSESVTDGVISSIQAEPADIFESLVNFSNAAVTSQLSERGVSNNEASTKLGVLLEADGQSLHNKDNLGGLQRVDDGNENQSVIASVMQAVNSDTQSLIDAYKHMNDQILLNERAVEESSSHVHALVGYSPTAATDFRRQVNELQASIGAEKTKRDVRVAALIAHVWKPRCEEFKSLFDTPFQNAPRNEQVYHKKWAEVASEIYMKDNIISELERQMEALGGGNGRSRYAEMGELSSKIAAEYAAKMALESKREDFYVGLVQSNSRIRTLVRNALL
ncbi:hypothetical protein KXD40_001493 [Peronospora effusa]|uniref:Uncharacterized protein n=1 Tax=Peronospora effusa TaxID=542832 RepID=A0A3M6VLI7_9STRA|nr:hypothetical protein DD238_001143 [Peronospora effusa]RQM13828.1 hypothetical protein DD237_002024 [Peronospora effusa]UIZ26215.1 hypothetical protein KXD40_001493 [Peronospora effusa]CAI5711165.1 unnamed protein product [Peronospora effusa]